MEVFETEDITVSSAIPAPWMSVDVSAAGLSPSSFAQGEPIVLNFHDDEPTGTPQDVVTVTTVWHDECGGQATATLDITVKNKAPEAQDDSAETSAEASVMIDGLADNDTDASMSDTLTITGVDATGTTGSVTFDNGSVTYDPNGQFDSLARGATATDTFTYTVEDDDTGSDTGTVAVTVTGSNHAPTAISLDNTEIEENRPRGSLVATLTATDADSDRGQFFLVSGAGDNDNELFSIENDNELRTAAFLDFESQEVYHIRIRVYDGWGGEFETPVTINVTDKDESSSRNFVVRGEFMDADWDFFGNPNGAGGDEVLGAWSQTLTANCNDIGHVDMDPVAVLPNSTTGEMDAYYHTDIDYDPSGESATVQLSSSFMWEGNDPGFWDAVGMISTGMGVGMAVAGVATGANPVATVVGGVIGAAAGSGVLVGAHAFGEDPMGSEAHVQFTVECYRAPPERWGVGRVTDKWLPAWGVSTFFGSGTGGLDAVTLVEGDQYGHGYQRFVAEGFVYRDPSTGYLPGRITDEMELETTTSPES